jgi:hypothetical protein
MLIEITSKRVKIFLLKSNKNLLRFFNLTFSMIIAVTISTLELI